MKRNLTNIIVISGLLFLVNNPVAKAEKSTIIDKSSLNLMANSQLLYQQGELDKAIVSLKNVISQAEKQGDIVSQTQGLINLSLIYLHQGKWQDIETNLTQIKQLIPQLNNSSLQDKFTIFALEIEGQLQLSTGQTKSAIVSWQKSSQLAEKIGETERYIYSKIKEIEGLEELGIYAQAVKVSQEIQGKIAQLEPNLTTAKAWQSTGELLAKLSQFSEAKLAFDNALNIAQKLNNPDLIGDIYLSQGNATLLENKLLINEANNNIQQLENNKTENQVIILREKERQQLIIDNAIEQVNNYYQKSLNTSNNQTLNVIAELAQFNLLFNYKKDSISEQTIQNILNKIDNLDKSNPQNQERIIINNQINFASKLISLNPKKYQQEIIKLLTNSYQKSNQINYKRGQSNALGELAKLYLASNQWQEAQKITEKALAIAQEIKADDLSYQWQWQLGKIARKQNQRDEAIVAYTQSVNILKSLRGDLVGLGSGIASDLEYNFREDVEPVYRELVDILLQPMATSAEINQGRDVMESLQIAELDNYFQDACLDIKEVNLDKILDEKSAVVYPIILPDRIEVIVSLPKGITKRYTTKISQNELEMEINNLINSFNDIDIADLDLTNKKLNNLYNYTLKSAEKDLNSSQIKRLIFVLDGFFKSVPMNALYDGNKYLIEKYEIAIAPSLKLIDVNSFSRENREILLAGLSQTNPENERQYSDLPSVASELNAIQQTANNSRILLNKDFTESNFQGAIATSPYSIIHIATHGEFSSKLEDTFLLTWDQEININELNRIFSQYGQQKKPVQLLVLSACKTAAGDKRAGLGLAGVAVRVGARSTLASLWYVSDKSTELLMSKFHQQLKQESSSKSQALRQAQIEMIQNPEFNHPYFWSAFILIGNWN